MTLKTFIDISQTPCDSTRPKITHFPTRSPPRPPAQDRRLTSHTALGHGRSEGLSASGLHRDAENATHPEFQIRHFLLNP